MKRLKIGMRARFFNYPISLLLKMALYSRKMAAARNAVSIGHLIV
ncbi:hypothetical protein [Neisseria wadsworthii]|nr:hypothetical protein [Neisseria wadsworthii]